MKLVVNSVRYCDTDFRMVVPLHIPPTMGEGCHYNIYVWRTANIFGGSLFCLSQGKCRTCILLQAKLRRQLNF